MSDKVVAYRTDGVLKSILDFNTQVETSRLDQMATPTSDVSMGGHKLTSVADATNATDAMNRQTGDARYASTATAITSLTGDVAATGPGAAASTIQPNVVDNTKAADMAQATFKMRAAGAGTGDPIDGTAAQAKTALAIASTDVSGLGNLAVANVDNSTLEISAGTLREKDGGTTNAKLATVATSTIKGRITAGTGAPEDLTAAQAKTVLAIMSADVSDFTEAAQDAVGAALTDTATLDLVYNDGANTVSGNVLDSPTVAGATPAQLRDRATHTGTQLASTISNFDTQVRTNRLDQMAAPTGDVSMNTHKLTTLQNGAAASQDAATVAQMEAAISAAIAAIPSSSGASDFAYYCGGA